MYLYELVSQWRMLCCSSRRWWRWASESSAREHLKLRLSSPLRPGRRFLAPLPTLPILVSFLLASSLCLSHYYSPCSHYSRILPFLRREITPGEEDETNETNETNGTCLPSTAQEEPLEVANQSAIPGGPGGVWNCKP